MTEVIRNPSAFARHQQAVEAAEVEVKVCYQTKPTFCVISFKPRRRIDPHVIFKGLRPFSLFFVVIGICRKTVPQ